MIFKNGTKTRNCKSLFKQILPWGKKLKTCQEWPHLLSSRFIKVFYKTTTCPRRPHLSGPKSGRLIQVWLYIQRIQSLILTFIMFYVNKKLLSSAKFSEYEYLSPVRFTLTSSPRIWKKIFVWYQFENSNAWNIKTFGHWEFVKDHTIKIPWNL